MLRSCFVRAEHESLTFLDQSATVADDDDRDAPSDGGGFQPISLWGDLVRGQLQQHPDVSNNIRSTVAGVVGPGFSPQELDTLRDRAIEASGPGDAAILMGIQSGVPLTLSVGQWNAIDGLLRRMPQDSLGQRAYSAFKSGLANGKIRVRQKRLRAVILPWPGGLQQADAKRRWA